MLTPKVNKHGGFQGIEFLLFFAILFISKPQKLGDIMSQKSEFIIEEKPQINLLEESSKLIINTSVFGFIGAAFMSAMGKQNLILLMILGGTLALGIAFRFLSSLKNKESKIDN
jgi:hypothetical protein